MIKIPELEILSLLTDLLMNDLPPILLELEEQSENSIHLPPLRYAGTPELLPAGTQKPYALLEIEESSYTEKDRIIKNVRYEVACTLEIPEKAGGLYYFAAMKDAVESSMQEKFKIVVLSSHKQHKSVYHIQIK
jgi:hypothetical protein